MVDEHLDISVVKTIKPVIRFLVAGDQFSINAEDVFARLDARLFKRCGRAPGDRFDLDAHALV